jgi:leucyl aminopeptidase
MTGASTLFGAILLASKWKVPNRVIAVLGFVENMPDGEALQPGNVITARNGLTVEVINTDAEGRLVLADILDYAQDQKVGGAAPAVVINAATLTGAVAVALGKYCCGLMTNDDGLAQQLIDAGKAHGERLWPLPQWDEYFDDLKTEYADMRNVANDGNGGTIRGGIFLKQFIRKGVKWAHLDIACTAWGVTHLSYLPKKGASGLHVRTVARFLADFRG